MCRSKQQVESRTQPRISSSHLTVAYLPAAAEVNCFNFEGC